MALKKAFEKSVFINCPFDDEYRALLRPLLFTTLFARLHPRIALEAADSGSSRISKILSMIKESKFAIHDISRCQAKKAGEYFRFNMPFELGLDVGCKTFGIRRQKAKRCLVLEAERFRYQAALSDLSNSDIADHGNDPEKLVGQVRNWFVQECDITLAPPSIIWGRFLDFMSDNDADLKKDGYSKRDIEGQPIKMLMNQMASWISKN